MPENIPEKGAAVQNDLETYAVIPYLLGGFTDPQTLRKIADVSEKYGAKSLKLTSEHRIAIIGIKYEDIDNVWKDLDMKPGGFNGKIVRPVKLCVGASYCKMGKQKTIEMGMKVDKKFMGVKTPNKIKIAISGCQNSCAEPAVRDIGFIGTRKGWNIYVGGTAGMKPRIADLIAKNLSDEDSLDLMDKIIEYYIEKDEKRRLGRLIDKIGFENFKKNLN